MPARLGLQLAYGHREPRERMHRRAGHVRRQRREMELHVGSRRVGHRAREQAALVDADRHRALAAQDEVEADREPPVPRREGIVGRDRLRAAEDHPRLQVILQVLADTGQRVHDGDAELLQQRRRPDARQLQELRRLQRARCQDDLATRGDLDVASALSIGDPGCAAAVEAYARRLRLRLGRRDWRALPPAADRRRQWSSAGRGAW